MPRNEPAFLVAKSRIEKADTANCMQGYKCTVNLKNTGKNRIYIISSLYTVTGHNLIKPGYRTNDSGYNAGLNYYKDGSAVLPRYYWRDDGMIVENGELVNGKTWLEPSEEIPVEFFTYIPKNIHFNELQFDVIYLETKDTSNIRILDTINQCAIGTKVLYKEKNLCESKILSLKYDEYITHHIFQTESSSFCQLH